MLDGIVPNSPGRRKNKGGGIAAHNKKLKGLRLTCPLLSAVLAKHIGLGATADSIYP
jgi:hypothetical protein